MKTERFGIIPKNAKLLDFAPYYVTKDGSTVFSMISGRPIKQRIQTLTRVNKKGERITKPGYVQVWLRHKDGVYHWHKVHRLVASLFVVNYKPSTQKEVGHKDNNKLNNHYTNLYWTDHRGNVHDAIKSGLNIFGKNDLSGGRTHWMSGVKHTDGAKKLMSLAKVGEKHPKFKGWYIYEGNKYSSFGQLAEVMGTYTMKVKRMFDKGVIAFEPKICDEP